jgi:hypothetical protein
MNQLSLFESRLNKTGIPLTTNFEDDPCANNESDELLVRNTFLNGLPNKKEKKDKPLNLNNRRLQWADGNKNKKDLLCSFHNKDILLNHKDIKPIVSHKGQRANKTILKRSISMEFTKHIKLDGMPIKKELDTSTNNSLVTNELKNSFILTTDEQVSEKKTKEVKSQSEVTNIIIAPNMKNFINNNIQNIYVNNNTDMNKITNNFLENKDQSSLPTAKTSNTRDSMSSLGVSSKSSSNLSNINPSSKLTTKMETKSALQNNFTITNLIE